MKKFLQKIFKYKVGQYALYILFYAVILPMVFIGKTIYFTSKLIRALGFLLMGKIHSAKEEVTRWDVELYLKDVL